MTDYCVILEIGRRRILLDVQYIRYMLEAYLQWKNANQPIAPNMPGSVPGSVATSGEVGVVSANEASEYRDGQTEHVEESYCNVKLRQRKADDQETSESYL